MKFEIQKDSTLKCSSYELTLNDIETLNNTQFIENTPVTIQCNKIHQEALLPFFKFVSKVKCLYVTFYVEDLDYETARAIYFFAKKNSYPLKMKLDLGEQILAFISSCVMNTLETQDIEDHLISGIYSKVHTLVLEYRSMSYIQAVKLSKALLRTQLQALDIHCYVLDEETKGYLKNQVTQWLAIPSVSFFVQDQDQLSVVPAREQSLGSTTGRKFNCFKRVLTWFWSQMPHGEEARTEEEPDDEEANRIRSQPKPHFS